MKMEFSAIRFEICDGVAVIHLNIPEKLNALTNPMIDDLFVAAAEITDSTEIRAVVITGEGRAFCAGGDLDELRECYGGNTGFARHMERVSRLMVALVELPVPVIAAVNGAAVGAGMNIALSADLVIASEKAKFSEIFSNIGLVPDLGGTYFLPRLVGRQKAKELIFTARMVTAQEALQIGLVTEVVPEAELEEKSMALARRLAKGPTSAYTMAKKMVNKSFEVDLRTALDYEGMAQAISGGSADFKEGLAAFQEKRKPDFEGR